MNGAHLHSKVYKSGHSQRLGELLKPRISSFRNRGYCGHDSVAPAFRALSATWYHSHARQPRLHCRPPPDMTARPKQRYTAQRIFERLQDEHGYSGGYSAVKEYVREVRTTQHPRNPRKAAFSGRPLLHRPSTRAFLRCVSSGSPTGRIAMPSNANAIWSRPKPSRMSRRTTWRRISAASLSLRCLANSLHKPNLCCVSCEVFWPEPSYADRFKPSQAM